MPIQLLALLLAAAAQTPGKDHVKVQLALAPPTAAAGGETRARLQFAIDSGWHIYPHDFTGTGNKTVVEAKFPDGITLGELTWPAPTILELFNEKTPVHEGEITAEGIVSVASSVKPGSYELGFDLTYQVCSSVCVDGKKSLTATLVVTAADPNKPAAKGNPTPTKQKPLAGVSLAAPSTYEGKLGVEMELSKDGLAPGEEAVLELKLAIGPGWHAYSPKSEAGGQIPIAITLEGLEKVGALESPEGTKHVDALLKITLYELTGDVTIKQRVRAPRGGIAGPVFATMAGQICDVNSCLPPGDWKFQFDVRALEAAPNGAVSSGAGPDTSAATAGSLASMSLGLFLLTSVLGGWASLFTPCVFPMIPITVSFFSKRAGGKRGRAVMLAWTYALGIMATFTLIGVAFSVFFGAASLANFATNVWVNLGMGTVFVALGLSLLGLFTIAAPSGLTNKIDEARGEAKNDLVMTLLMAIAFTLASFTCTVPVLGALLGLSATGGSIARPIAGMLAYSAAFAAPFFLLALFPTTLQRLPKGGAWLEVVKISMGLVEFAAALKFLSNADIGADTQILTRPVFLAIWIALFLALALYLFGILKLPGAEGEVGAIRAMFGVTSLAFALYLFAGLFGLRYGQFLESFLPPDGYGGQSVAFAATRSEKKHLSWYQTLDEGLEVAKKENRRLFLNFTGDQCVNCRGMEQGFFPRPEIAKELEKFVRVELWLDRTSTPELAERSKRYYEYEIKKFDTIARPLYAILEPDGETVVAKFEGSITNNADEARFIRMLTEN